MNSTIFWATWREKASSVVLLVMLAGLVAVPSLFASTNLRFTGSTFVAVVLTLLVAAGSIGKESAAGTLALVFCRPITRTEYVLTKWAALSSLSFALLLVGVGVQSAVAAYHDHAFAIADVARYAAEVASLCTGLVAVLVMLSSFVRKTFDAGLWLIAVFVSSIATGVSHPPTHRIGQVLLDNLMPHLDWAHTFDATPIAWSELLGWASTTCVCLTIASFVLSRKDLSYAS